MTSQGWGAQLHCTAEEIGEWPSVMASLCREAHNNTSHFWQMIFAKLDTRHRVSSKRHILFGNNVRILLTIFSLEEGNIAVFIPTTSWPPLHTIHPTPVQFSFAAALPAMTGKLISQLKPLYMSLLPELNHVYIKCTKAAFPTTQTFAVIFHLLSTALCKNWLYSSFLPDQLFHLLIPPFTAFSLLSTFKLPHTTHFCATHNS